VDHVELFICDEYTPHHYVQQVWSPTEPLQTLQVSFLAEQHLLSINTEMAILLLEYTNRLKFLIKDSEIELKKEREASDLFQRTAL
jgi:hypothetical protein